MPEQEENHDHPFSGYFLSGRLLRVILAHT